MTQPSPDQYCRLLDIEYYPYMLVAPFTYLAGLTFAFSAFVFLRLRAESNSVTGFLTILVTEMLVCLSSGACLSLKLMNIADNRAACLDGSIRELLQMTNSTNQSVEAAVDSQSNRNDSLSSVQRRGKYFPIPLLVAFYCSNYLLFARNYCIVVKTALTLIAIASPMRSRVMLTAARARMAFAACYVFALAPNCVRFSAEAFHVYVRTDLLPHYIQLLTHNHDTIHGIIFALQGPVPAGLAFTISLVISWRLLRHRKPGRRVLATEDPSTNAAAGGESQVRRLSMSQRLCSVLDRGDSGAAAAGGSNGAQQVSTKAVIRVMLVALIFAQCEVPTTVLATMDSGEETTNVVASRVVGNLFVIADSYFNLVVIALTNRRFLRKSAQLLAGKPADRLRPFSARNLPLPARETVFRRV